MATVPAQTTNPAPEVIALTWSGMANGDVGGQASAPQFADKSVQASGTFTALTIEGSNDGTNWATLHDNTGAALTFTGPGIKVVLENTLFMRPNTITAGAADVKVIVIGKGT
jgi:hypothetical protein